MGSITRKVYQKTLPRKRISAGCLLYDESGRVLLVDPTYKKNWEIPGGTVEERESPWHACRREVKEEIGLDIAPSRLLCVDYSGTTKTRTESLNFIFDGGMLSVEQIGQIALPIEELGAFCFAEPHEIPTLLTRRLGRRVQRALEVLGSNAAVYLDEQEFISSLIDPGQ